MAGDLEAASEAYRAGLQRVQDGLAEVASARADVPKVRERLATAIVAAYRDGWRVGEIARVSGYGREQVRRILRAGGVEPRDTGTAEA
nr:helix-turn-helix domain-containing protein [Micromonospora sp. DSM 115978]